MSEAFRNLEVHRSYLNQVAENGARMARVTVEWITTGNGEAQGFKAVPFGLNFTERPTLAHGTSLYSGALVDGSFPNTSAGVWKWQRDARGFYSGAFLYFVCDSNGQDYTLQHDLTFEGEAIKLLGAELLG